jgi:hypothetical protein
MPSRLVAAAGLVAALYLYGRNWSYTGVFYLVAHVFVVGGLAGLSRLLRDGRDDGASRALNTLAMGLPLVSFVGAALAVASAGEHDSALDDGRWGASPALVASELRHGWTVWLPLLLVVVASLGWRRAALARLGPVRAVATGVAVVAMPLLLVPGAAAVAREFMRGGAETLVVYPLLAASIGTAWSWVRGSTSSLRRGLRQLSLPVALVGVALATLLAAFADSRGSWLDRWSGDPGSYGAWTYGWSIVSLQRLGGVLVLFAVALSLAEDPGPRIETPPHLGPYRGESSPPDR